MRATKFSVLVLCYLFLFTSCDNSHLDKNNRDRSADRDSINKQKSIDAQMALGDRPDTEQEGPSFEEVKADLLASYDKVKITDTLIVDGKDSLHVYTKYYCLHYNSLVIPKKYIWGGKDPKDLITNTFVQDIIVKNNQDTIFNKTIKKNDFSKVIFEEERRYATLCSASFIGYKKDEGGLIFGYSISIPITDVGVPAYLVIDKKGNFKILDEYAKVD